MTEKLQKAYDFLKKSFDECDFYKNPERADAKRYRFEHSIRVCKAGFRIAEGEGFDDEKKEALQIACLLHDFAYTTELPAGRKWSDHGRIGAQLVRPFLEELGYSGKLLDDMLFGIAIHADGKADFEGEYNAFSLSVMNADDIDRFAPYRLIMSICKSDFLEKNHEDRLKKIWDLIGFYQWSRDNQRFGTETAKNIITEELNTAQKFAQAFSDQEYITTWDEE